jgi:hypothetical protein
MAGLGFQWIGVIADGNNHATKTDTAYHVIALGLEILIINGRRQSENAVPKFTLPTDAGRYPPAHVEICG